MLRLRAQQQKSSMSLVGGTVLKLLASDHSVLPCRLQVLETKNLASSRTRVVVSDGKWIMQALLNPPLTKQWVTPGHLTPFRFIVLRDFMMITVKNHSVLLPVALELAEQGAALCGEPVEIPAMPPESTLAALSSPEPPPSPPPSFYVSRSRTTSAPPSLPPPSVSSKPPPTRSPPKMSAVGVASTPSLSSSSLQSLGTSRPTPPVSTPSLASPRTPVTLATPPKSGAGAGEIKSPSGSHAPRLLGIGRGNGAPGVRMDGLAALAALNASQKLRSSSWSAADAFVPIDQLSPYLPTWTIRARVTQRSPIKEFTMKKTPHAQSKLASCDLLDASGGEIRVSMFGAEVDRFYNLFLPGRVVTVSRGEVRGANTRFSTLKNEFEIALSASRSQVFLVDEVADEPAAAAIPLQKYEFTSIADCERLDATARRLIDVIGVVRSVAPSFQFTSRASGKPMTKRTLVLSDTSGRSIDVVLWGETAQNYGGHRNDPSPPLYPLEVGKVLAVKACRVSDYAPPGTTHAPVRNLDASFGSTLAIEPATPETKLLHEWWTTGGGRESSIDSVTKRLGRGPGGGNSGPIKSVVSIASERLGRNDRGDNKGDYFNVRGTITHFQNDVATRPPWYDSCPNQTRQRRTFKKDDDASTTAAASERTCMKKALPNAESGGWQVCAGCGQPIDRPRATYVLSFLVTDATGGVYVSAFGEQAQVLLGDTPADELKAMVDRGDLKSYDAVFAKHNFRSYTFRLRAKLDNYIGENGPSLEPRVKCELMSAQTVKYDRDCYALLDEVALLESAATLPLV